MPSKLAQEKKQISNSHKEKRNLCLVSLCLVAFPVNDCVCFCPNHMRRSPQKLFCCRQILRCEVKNMFACSIHQHHVHSDLSLCIQLTSAVSGLCFQTDCFSRVVLRRRTREERGSQKALHADVNLTHQSPLLQFEPPPPGGGLSFSCPLAASEILTRDTSRCQLGQFTSHITRPQVSQPCFNYT